MMFNNQTIRLIAFAAFALVSAAASAQNVVYLTASKDEHPWGSETVEKDFDVVFGEKAWTHGTFDDGEGAYLNSEKTSLLVIEGGDWMAEGMAKYLQSHGDEIGKFVESGGSIIINAAPNVGTTIDLGKDLQIGYPSYSWGAKKDLVVALTRYLREQHGLDVCRDEDGSSVVPPIGGSTDLWMARAIERSHTVIVCVSRAYVASVNCQKEARYAHQRRDRKKLALGLSSVVVRALLLV
jgi:hypothetical protein